MTKEIVMKGGAVVLVDDEDFPVVSRYSWRRSNKKGYPMTTFKANEDGEFTVYLHKMVMGMGCFGVCDHINGDVLDCQKQNLRRATYAQNSANMPKRKGTSGKPNTSQYKGVQPSGKRWRATIGFNKKVIQLGSHDTEEQAALAYNAKAKELFGEYAWLNPVPDAPQVTTH